MYILICASTPNPIFKMYNFLCTLYANGSIYSTIKLYTRIPEDFVPTEKKISRILGTVPLYEKKEQGTMGPDEDEAYNFQEFHVPMFSPVSKRMLKEEKKFVIVYLAGHFIFSSF